MEKVSALTAQKVHDLLFVSAGTPGLDLTWSPSVSVMMTSKRAAVPSIHEAKDMFAKLWCARPLAGLPAVSVPFPGIRIHTPWRGHWATQPLLCQAAIKNSRSAPVRRLFGDEYWEEMMKDEDFEDYEDWATATFRNVLLPQLIVRGKYQPFFQETSSASPSQIHVFWDVDNKHPDWVTPEDMAMNIRL